MRLFATILFIVCQFTSNGQSYFDSPEGKKEIRVVAVSNSGEKVESTSNSIKVDIVPKIYVPEAFSPDNDGINDYFYATAKGLKMFEINIYDRWGNQVFSSNNPSSKWDGKKSGNDVPVGGYVYDIEYMTFNSDETFRKKGTLALVR